MDTIDKELVKSANRHMVDFNLIKFKIDFPSLYATLRETINNVSSKSNQQREISREDLLFG